MTINNFIASRNITVSAAMQKMDGNAGGTLFLTDEDDKLIACITDGDIRRYLLSGGKMDSEAFLASNKHPRYAMSLDEAKHLFHKKNYVAIPIVDEDMTIIDIYSDYEMVTKSKASLRVPVVINAGGKGTRLAPYTKVLPKPLIPVGDLPILEHIMNTDLNHVDFGMSAATLTEEEEFRDIYGMDVIVIPTNKPVIRKDLDDAVYMTKKEKYKAVVERIKAAHEKHQPVLVGTITIEVSELLSDMLRREGIPHNVLNAKFHEQEAAIIKDAGIHDAVTIATNMAGRGTDIKLDEEAKNAGGLLVIGTERHESRRIDN